MRLEYQILLALGLDLLIGDPRWFPHPVKLIGRSAAGLEPFLRRSFSKPRAAGVAMVLVITSLTGLGTFSLIAGAQRWGARWIHPLAGDIVSILVIYTSLAVRDLIHHSYRVYRCLKDSDLDGARQRVALMVGRDTDRLDEEGVARAAVESVAENMVDGITAPLFFTFLAGPVGAMVYKAINTLDSTFGYKNERYREFGWASARIDDGANYLPARLTAPLVPVAAALLKLKPLDSLRILRRDRKKHPSPNSGFAEAAFAGALGVQLGGLNYYFGCPSAKPVLGDSSVRLSMNHILKANALALATTALATLFLFGLRMALF
ncbi:MAG: adenosylcobinamide-phosphate synthase CbiB [bacterium]